MTRMWLLTVIGLSLFTTTAVGAPAGYVTLFERVSKVVQRYYSDAEIAQDDGKLTAKHGTMVFTVHRHWKTGEIRKETDEVEGPNFRGFVLRISVRDGKYEGQAMVPQTLREPYWQTYIDRPPTEDGKGYYVIDFSYGSRLSRAFMSDLFEILPRTRMPTKK